MDKLHNLPASPLGSHGENVKYSETDIRDKLISRLLELGYPKSSIVLELGLEIGRTSTARIDLAILDPETNKILSVFEVKKDSKNLGGAVQQLISYSKVLPENILAFLYSLDGGEEEIYSVNPKSGEVSRLYDLPNFDSLRNSYSNPLKEQYEREKKKKSTARTWSNIVAGMSSSIAIAITIAMATGLLFSEKKTLNNSELTEKHCSASYG